MALPISFRWCKWKRSSPTAAASSLFTHRFNKHTRERSMAQVSAYAAVPADVPLGGYVCRTDQVSFDADKPVTTLTVRNTGDRPVQVGSHFHFFEANRALEFDRAAAFGLHLDIPSSTAMRFEPGDQREVSLVPYGGKRAA